MVMSHGMSDMSRKKCPANWFCGLVTWIDNTQNMVYNDITSSSPLIDGKVLDINVS